MSLWQAMFLAERYGRLTLTLDEVAEQIGLAAGTIRNRRTGGDFAWLKSDGRELRADVSDVAEYLAQQRRIARAAIQETPPHSASGSRQTDAPSRPSGRRRPSLARAEPT